MAKEIFLLEYQSQPNDPGRLNWYADHLASLSVGQKPGIEPILFRPESQPHIADAQYLAAALGAYEVYEANLPGEWKFPFRNQKQANACVIGTLAARLAKREASLAPDQDAQMVVIGSREMAQYFKRLNPNGVSVDRSNVDPRSRVFSTYYINHVNLC